MLALWSAKGGSGCSVVASGLGLLSARNRPTLLVDLGGDLPAILGLNDQAPGVTDWLAATDPPPDALARLEQPVADGLSLLPFGSAATDPSTTEPGRDELLAGILATEARRVVADVGSPTSALGRAFFDASATSVLVTRLCYLAARRVGRLRVPADGVVAVAERGRALRPADVAAAVGAPLLARVTWDPTVARSVDAGTLAGGRLPRALSPLRAVLDPAPSPGHSP